MARIISGKSIKKSQMENISALATIAQQDSLEETIAQDCEQWEKLNNKGQSIESYLYLNKCKDIEQSGMYQLILNGCELWFGTLQEINAIVKSMVVRLDKNDFID